MPNYNPTTKHPYGVASLNSFCDDVASELYQRAYDATMDSLNLSDEEREYADLDSVDADVTLDGVTVHVGSLGGATLVWSVDGPLQSRRARCSPCVPGAVNWDSGEGTIRCHGFPLDWMRGEES